MSNFAEIQDLTFRSLCVQEPQFRPNDILWVQALPATSLTLPRPLIAATAQFADEWIGRWHNNPYSREARPVGCYFVCDAVVSGDGQIWIDGQLVSTPELMPGYVRSQLGLPANGQTLLRHVAELPLRVIDGPCIVMQGTQNIYGHFLIETLLYMLLVGRVMRSTGIKKRYLLPSSVAPWLLRIFREHLGVDQNLIELYNPHAECVLLRQAILPTMLHQDGGFHPLANNLLAELTDAIKPRVLKRETKRLFLIRGTFASHSPRKCINEPALIDYACNQHGFVPIALEKLSWPDQIGLIANADILLGLYGSGLHGALFAPRETRVASLGLLNNVQAEIGALRGHKMAFYTKDFESNKNFLVDEAEFAQFVLAVCA